MGILEAIILGIIQGLTEFLPVSSSGHIELGKVLLNAAQKEDPLLFSIVVHAATALSTMVVYWKDILQILRDLFKFEWNDSTRFAALVLLSMIPAGVVGLLFKDELEQFFTGNLLLVGAMLWVTALLLWFSARSRPTDRPLNGVQAFLIGIAQAIAILPGISRSGATISTALLQGVDREQAARFSFLMVLPLILGAALLELKDYLEADPASTADISPAALGLGFLAAFLAGLVACRWMIALVKRSKLHYFAIYCLIVGGLAIGYHLLNLS